MGQRLPQNGLFQPGKANPYTLILLPNAAANHLLDRIKDENGPELRSSDDLYHCKVNTGAKASSNTLKRSHEGVALLTKVLGRRLRS